MTAEDRFWAKVQKSDDCWLWTGQKNKGGYGALHIGSRTDGSRRSVRAHRFAYELLVGPIPQGLHLDHLCRVPSCVNPAHLEPVTPSENQRRGINGTRRLVCARGHWIDQVGRRSNRACKACSEEQRRTRRRSEAAQPKLRIA